MLLDDSGGSSALPQLERVDPVELAAGMPSEALRGMTYQLGAGLPNCSSHITILSACQHTADRLVAECLAAALESESLLAGMAVRLDQLAAAGQARQCHAEQQQQQQQQQQNHVGNPPEVAVGEAPAPQPSRRGTGSKRKRSGAAAGDPPASKLGTGLRHFSLKVCLRVEAMGQTTYNDVADELVTEIAAEAAAGAPPTPRLRLARPPGLHAGRLPSEPCQATPQA